MVQRVVRTKGAMGKAKGCTTLAAIDNTCRYKASASVATLYSEKAVANAKGVGCHRVITERLRSIDRRANWTRIGKHDQKDCCKGRSGSNIWYAWVNDGYASRRQRHMFVAVIE